MNPTRGDFALIKEIAAGGEKRYASGDVNRRPYERLEELGWVNGIITNISDVEYCLTPAGVEAAKMT